MVHSREFPSGYGGGWTGVGRLAKPVHVGKRARFFALVLGSCARAEVEVAALAVVGVVVDMAAERVGSAFPGIPKSLWWRLDWRRQAAG